MVRIPTRNVKIRGNFQDLCYIMSLYHSLVTLLPGPSTMYNIIIIIGQLMNCELIAMDFQAY